jgi:hypothetical protein
MSRLFMIAVVLGIAIGLPYLGSRQSSQNNSVAPPPPAATPAESGASALAPPKSAVTVEPAKSPARGPGPEVNSNPAPLEGAQIQAIEQVLRFDLTKDWVYRTWTRKSTGPTDVGLFAVRVPLVTGTHVAALAGSLTYYFNSAGQVEHISFRGRTGDTTHIVNFLAQTYEFKRAEAPIGEQVYQVKRGHQTVSELRTRTEPVLWTNSPHSSIAIELELARPGSRRVFPPRPSSLDIPPSAALAAAPTDGAEADASSNSYLDKMRYATPQEEGQVLWKRWPN